MGATTGVFMKPKMVPLPNLYDEAKVRKSGWRYPARRAFFIFVLVLVLLAAVRFLNQTFLWNVFRMELENGPRPGRGEYAFLVASARMDRASLLLTARTVRPLAETVVIGYHDFFRPARFLIRCGKPLSFVDVGPALVAVGPGVSAVTLYASDIVEIGSGGSIRAAYFGDSPLAPAFRRLARNMENRTESANPLHPAKPISFLLKPPETSPFLRIPPLLYFFLPGVLILLLAALYGRAVFCSFFYYLELFFLFSGKKALVSVPFFWLFRRRLLEPSDPWTWGIAVLLLLLFTAGGTAGLLDWKKIGRGRLEKWIVLFFLLLPLALRF
jgi:hypothetical protein